MTEKPIISIVTPCLNRADMIVTAIESVLTQNYPHFEHIIVDGGSNDGTLDILGKYPHLRWISEPDHGMYSAINKGINLSQGNIIGFLNSDDLYPQGVFQNIADMFIDEAMQAVAGSARLFHEGSDGRKESISLFPPSQADQLLNQMILGIPAFNAWFFRKNVIRKLNGFNEGYKIAADREFMIRLALAHIPYAILDQDTYEYRQHMDSLTISEVDANYSRIIPEHLRMTENFITNPEIPKRVIRLLKDMRTRDMLNLAAYNYRKRNYRQLGNNLRDGMRFDKTWPLKFLWRVLCRIIHPRRQEYANR
jgi:glycosyltransferase involved in cell wall biosynthesis